MYIYRLKRLKVQEAIGQIIANWYNKFCWNFENCYYKY